MADWLSKFKYDPIKPLLESKNNAIIYFTKRDLLDEKVEATEYVWSFPEVLKILKNNLKTAHGQLKVKQLNLQV